MKEKTLLPKKTSTPLKSIGAQMAHLLAKEMTSGKNVPGYKPPKTNKEKKAMNIKQMAAQAREHWKVTNPEIYKQMVEDGALIEESEASARLTMREMEALMLIGMSEQEAWQESRHLFIFKTAHQMEEAYHPERDENGKVIPSNLWTPEQLAALKEIKNNQAR